MRTNSTATTQRWEASSVLVGVAVAVLLLIGFLILFSSTLPIRQDPYFFIKRQAIWALAALLVGFTVYHINLEWARRFVWPLVLVAFLAQAFVLIPGMVEPINGARRWVDLSSIGLPMQFQVSELAKLAIVFGLAHLMDWQIRHIQTFWRGFVLPCAILGIFCLMIMRQPDFGTAAVCGAVGAALLFVAGVRWRYLIPSALAALSLFAVMVWYDPVRLGRVVHFLDAEAHREGGTYQLWQGMLAFVSGGIFGVGPGNGRQQMAYLPEAHTDFIFPIIGEEYGLIATMGVLFCFLVIFLVTIRHMPRCPNLYQSLLFLGSCLFIILQAVINIGVVTGALPTKGLSLPFISYGGSNLVLMAILVAVMLNIMNGKSAVHGWTRSKRGLEEITG